MNWVADRDPMSSLRRLVHKHEIRNDSAFFSAALFFRGFFSCLVSRVDYPSTDAACRSRWMVGAGECLRETRWESKRCTRHAVR